MILYTPLSEADIFGIDQEAYANRQFLTINGRTVHAERNKDGSFRVLQLISTNPQDYLNETYAPGAIISHH
ncbi:YlzJ-like family protein [Virgibacillus senegalensis]|uniref:YlzJ-like family protein n=1 Tax=Virgibacillus senegalensis TaxID=1499679 RepID=UPI00069ECCAC|nr:YlzJ-like family protein [Virgibacillus senegalensis]